MWWTAVCHGWLVNGIDARLLSLSAACRGDAMLSCANILHIGAEVYELPVQSLALGNNIIEREGEWEKIKKREGLVR